MKTKQISARTILFAALFLIFPVVFLLRSNIASALIFLPDLSLPDLVVPHSGGWGTGVGSVYIGTSKWVLNNGCDQGSGSSSCDSNSGNCRRTEAGIPNDLLALISNLYYRGRASTGAGFTNLFQILNQTTGEWTDIGTSTSPALPAGDSAVTGPVSHIFYLPGDYYVRACADKNSDEDTGEIAEVNENNNCGDPTQITVLSFPITGVCSVTPASGSIGDTFIWGITSVSGGNNVYTYQWSGTDGLSGSGGNSWTDPGGSCADKTVQKSYTTAGIKTGRVAITSLGKTVMVNCANSVTVNLANTPPTAALDIQNASGASISSTNIGTTVYLSAFGSSDPDGNTTISTVKFCSDDSPNDDSCTNASGGPGSWTVEYAWGTSSGSWNAATKKLAWSFANSGNKGVYVQVKDNSNAWSAIVKDTINVLTLPDLTAGSITPTSATVGVATRFYATISNIGNASTTSGFYNFFQRANTYNASTDVATNVTNIGRVYSSALSAGGAITASLPSTFSSSGTYYIRACADKSTASDSGSITESNENNNCGAPWTAITISAVNTPPTAALDIQNASGASISSTNIGTTVYLSAFGSSDPDPGDSIWWVYFCSDDTPGDGGCDNGWTFYAWGTSSGDWNATTKKLAWSFSSSGNKGVYVKVKDGADAWSAIVEDTINVALPTYALNVQINTSGGTGTVTSNPIGINCGTVSGDCSETYNSGTAVTLTAVADFSSDFTGWSGACSGTGTCVVTMDAAKNVAATFKPRTCTAGCGDCDQPCDGGNQSCVRTDCSTYSQSCNTNACPSSADSNWREVAP